MKFLKWFFSILLLLIIAVAVGGYIFLKNFDLNRYKSRIENIVYEQTGRKLTIAGDASVGISLIPTIVINDVSFANPDWAKSPQMVKVGSIKVSLSLVPLLSKQIVIDRVLLNGPQIFLETSKSGQNSWDIELKSSTKPASISSNGWIIKNAYADEQSSLLGNFKDFVAKEIIIEEGILNYYNQQKNSLMRLDINSIRLSTMGINSPVNVEWDVIFNGMNFSGRGEFGSLAAFLSGQGEFPIKVDMNTLGIKSAIKGKIKDMLNEKLKASFSYNIYNPADNLNAPETTMIGTGEADLKNIALNISKLNIVNSTLKGEIKANISGSKPFINANIIGTVFDLGVFNRNKPTAFNFEIIKSAQATTLVPNDKIPYELLQLVNAKTKLQMEKLIVNPELALNDVKMDATLSGGLLSIPNLKFGIAGGKVDITADVNSQQKNISIKGSTENILLTDLVQQLKPSSADTFGVISGGNTQTHFDLKGSGNTYSQVVDSLSGQVIAVVEKAKVQTGKITFMANDFITQLLELIKTDKSKNKISELKCAVVRADIQNGLMTFPKGIAIDSDRIDFVSGGTISLPKDKVNLTLNIFYEGLTSVSITQALSNLVKITGTITSPRISINQEGTLKTIAGVALSGGTYAGAEMLLNRDSAPCYTALNDTIYKDKFEKPTGVRNAAQKTYQGTSQAVDNSINMVKTSAKEIKNAAKNLIRGTKKQKAE